MRKNIFFYLISFSLLTTISLYLNDAYKSLNRCTDSVQRNNLVFTNYQILWNQINNAAVNNPKLSTAVNEYFKTPDAGNITSLNNGDLFNADSTTIIKQINDLKSIAVDSVNIGITSKLSDLIQQEISWLLASNVPDSIIHLKANSHITALYKINYYIDQGKSRSRILIEDSKKQLTETIQNVIQWMIAFVVISVVLLIISVYGFTRQKSKTKIKEQELENTIREISDYKSALDESSIVAITNQKGIITHVNDNFCRISKYSKSELTGQDHRIINSGYHSKEFIRQLWVTIANGNIWKGELKNKAKDGTIYWVDTTIVPFLDTNGKPYQYLAIRSDITERKAIEENLERTMKERSNILERISDAFIALDNNYNFIYINKKATQIYGKSPDELIGKHCWTEYAHVIGSSFYESTLRAMETQEFIQIDKFYPQYNKWFEVNIYPSREGISIYFKNVTERKTAEAELLKANRLYAFISAVNQSIVHIKTQQELLDKACSIAFEIGNFKLAWAGMLNNENKFEVISLSGENVTVDQVRKGFEMDVQNRLMNNTPVGKALKTGEYSLSNDVLNDPEMDFLKEVLDAKGIRANIAFPLIKFGKVSGAFSFNSGTLNAFDDREIKLLKEAVGDISYALESIERLELHKIAEEKIIKSEKIYKTIASSIPGSVICLLDTSYTYLLTEGDMLQKLGYAKDIPGKKAVDVMPAEIFKQVDEQFKKVLQGETISSESHINGYDIISNFIPLKDENDIVYSIMTVAMDVTDLKKAQREINDLNHGLEQKINERTVQLENANKELESFSYSVSHDLRAPLRAVNGYAKMLEEDYYHQFDDEGKRLLLKVKDNARKMGELIDDLLTFSRMGKKEINKSKIDMSFLSRTAYDELIKTYGYPAKIKIGKLIPALADNILIKQVFLNLLSNALKYSSNSENPKVEINSEKINDEVVYSISDNGAGFDMLYAHKLFGVFQRLHSNEEFEGTGVGLAIVQRIILKHGGKVWAMGKVGKGSTFYFSLPYL